MRKLELLVYVTTALAGLTVIAGFMSVPAANAAHAARPGSCGEYMYWHDGKCVDARNGGTEPWTETMAKKKATW